MKLKLPKLSAGTIIIIIGLVMAMMLVLTLFFSPPDPLDAFVTSRQCDFIQYGDLSAASCTDGTNWAVSEYQP
jgi:hypothetical protein